MNNKNEIYKMQTYKLKNQKCFNLKDIFTCGQCFRWNEEQDGSYTGVVKENVINIKLEDKTDRIKELKKYKKTEKDEQSQIYNIKSVGKENLKELINQYFDLERDYQEIQKQLSKIDNNLRTSIEYGNGIRLLNQDLWETLISFIISANNNIPRIKKIIERLSQNFGKPIEFEGKTYYTFPTPEELKDVTIEKYRELGLGFRDKRIFETTHIILENKVKLKELEQNQNTQEVRQILLTLPGVGPKVADCILLFSTLKRLEVFPIDVWVNRVMNELYIHGEESKINKKQIEKLAKEKFGNLAGMAQQYLFYWRRDITIK